MTCLIIEDQPPAQRLLKKYIEDAGNLNLLAIYPDALQALDHLKAEQVDLLFLDIHLPKLSGIDFLRTLHNPPKVILTTAFSDYALESYELNVVDYLLKPFSFQRFVQAVAKVPPITKATPAQQSRSVLKTPEQQVLYVKSGYDLLKVTVSDIQYIHSDGDYTELFTSERRYLSTESLRHWSATLAEDQFIQIHKSYLVNTAFITKVTGNRVQLEQVEERLPIGRAYKEAFLKKIVS